MSDAKIDIQTGVSLAEFTTLGIGGPARYFVRADPESAIVAALEFAEIEGIEAFVLSGGSNLLVADSGFDGIVIHLELKGRAAVRLDNNFVAVTVAAGEDWDGFVEYCVAGDLAGIECLSGIPGYCGGTPVQNVGAYGQEVSSTISSVRCIDRQSSEVIDLSNAECGFSYRKSIFNSTLKDRYIVTAVTFHLEKGGRPEIKYPELERELQDIENPLLEDIRRAVIKVRKRKSMVIDAADVNSRSAGSFFKNPVVSVQTHDELAAEYAGIPKFGVDDGKVKVPAAWLIENAGFAKGFRLGNVGLSQKHTLAIVNYGGGTSAEVIDLVRLLRGRVREKFGLLLEPEPVFLGFNGDAFD